MVEWLFVTALVWRKAHAFMKQSSPIRYPWRVAGHIVVSREGHLNSHSLEVILHEEDPGISFIVAI